MDIAAETKRIMSILLQHKDKNFVQRILDPKRWPSLDLGGGNYASHKMAWSDDGRGRYWVYPTVIYDNKTRKLKDIGDTASDYALSSGEYIPMPTAEDADWLSKNYKLLWK